MLNKIKKIFRYSFLKKTLDLPPSLIFFVTSRCNARCLHCFYWKNLNKRNDLGFEEIGKLSRELGPMDSLALSGGEPFLREDLVRICRLFFENNKIKTLSIPTNGLDPLVIGRRTKEILKVAGKKKVFVNISLDGTEKIHNEIRQVPDAFKKVIASYSRLKELKKEYSNLNIGINITVHNKNYDNLFKLIDELKILISNPEILNISFLRGIPKDKSYKLPPRKKLAKLYQYIQECFGRNQPVFSKTINDLIFSLKLKSLYLKDQPLTCQAGKLIGVVDANGDVRPCELLPPIGNLRKASFKKIWQSQKAKIAREKIANHYCWCTHECFFLPTFLAYPKSYPILLLKLIKNWLWTKI